MLVEVASVPRHGLPEELRLRREALGLSVNAFARNACLDPSLVGRIERGEREATPKTLWKLSQALNVDPAFLLLVKHLPDGEDVGFGYVDNIETDGRYDNIGKLIRIGREQKGFSGSAFAAAAGIDQSLLSKIERGIVFPTKSVSRSLASVLGVNPFDLIIASEWSQIYPLIQEAEIKDEREELRRWEEAGRPPYQGPPPPTIEPPPAFAPIPASTPAPAAWRPISESAEPMIELPLWGAVGCGQGLELAHPELELVPARLAKGADGWVWARGRSMDAAGIEDGSQVYVRRAKRGEPKDGQVVLAHTSGGAVVKRFRSDGRVGFLMSETTAHPGPPPIAVGEGVEIQGIVIRVQRPMLEF